MPYILRLDDACPQMNFDRWTQVEKMLDQHQIKPIVGIIPDNADPDFSGGGVETSSEFWQKCKQWQSKKWTIAIHGLHHALSHHEPNGYFQKSHSVKTEFAGIPVDVQISMLEEGYHILTAHGLHPTCFFAPCHTYDSATVEAIAHFQFSHGYSLYISDGYALRPYVKNGVWFLPSLFDAPHAIAGSGIYTFVIHPNTLNDHTIASLKHFLVKYHKDFVNADDVMTQYMSADIKTQGVLGQALENGIWLIRGLRNVLKRKH